MIIVKLQGGLGNQMFQYAIGRCLADKKGVLLRVDTAFLDRGQPDSITTRHYELNRFQLSVEKVKALEMNIFFPRLSHVRFVRGIGRLTANVFQSEIVREPHFHFDPTVFQIASNNVYLDGFWQSRKYFKDIEEKIRRDFVFRTMPDGRNEKTLELIRGSESVSVHFRRGDFVTNKLAQNMQGVTSLKYYTDALDHIMKYIADPKIFIFTDEPQWVRSNFFPGIPYTLVSGNDGEKSFEDMRLMSQCKHNIIANSSFSWWAAWLNSHPGKIVIAPKIWLADQSKDTSDIIPEEWIKI